MSALGRGIFAVLFSGLLFFSATSCDNNATDNDGGGQTIVIVEFTFIPLELDATPGATIIVMNNDSTVHTVTSQSAPDAFDASGAFDSGIIPAGDARSIVIPADAAAGEDLFFYCDFLKGAMATPNGTIHVVAP